MKKVIQGDLEVSGKIKDTPKVWTVDDADIQSLESFLNEHSSEIKVGDVIHSNDDGLTATVYVINGGECKMYCATETVFPISYVLYYFYNGEWVFDEMTTPSSGTKLYKHIVRLSSNDELRLVSTRAKKYLKNQLGTDYMNNAIISGTFYDNDYSALEGTILQIDGDGNSLCYFEIDSGSIKSKDITNLTIVGDTVTSL